MTSYYQFCDRNNRNLRKKDREIDGQSYGNMWGADGISEEKSPEYWGQLSISQFLFLESKVNYYCHFLLPPSLTDADYWALSISIHSHATSFPDSFSSSKRLKRKKDWHFHRDRTFPVLVAPSGLTNPLLIIYSAYLLIAYQYYRW